MTALVLLIPGAEALVAPFRAEYDPVAPAGMPPHVTILVPFLEEDDITEDVLRKLKHHFAGVAPFDCVLRETGSFPGVLYLKPEPEATFSDVMTATSALFPTLLPYGRTDIEQVPHLTVAHAGVQQEFDAIRARFEERLAEHGPVSDSVSEATLMMHSGTAWLELARFGLSGTRSTTKGSRT